MSKKTSKVESKIYKTIFDCDLEGNALKTCMDLENLIIAASNEGWTNLHFVSDYRYETSDPFPREPPEREFCLELWGYPPE